MKRYVLTVMGAILFALAGVARTNLLVAVTSVNSQIRLDIRYATTNNFTGQQIYPVPKAYLRPAVAEKLSRAQNELMQQGLGLKVFDAYRPLTVQKKFWAILPDERYVANPAKGSRHNRGSAVDITLIQLNTGEELPMPTGYDNFTEKAHYAYTNLPPEVLRNRTLLRDTMVRNGFVPFDTEWWHFDDAAWQTYALLDLTIESLP
ncbi:MAG: M15 family metallopeptidase [Verrucomicrobia bacterium]|nr:M15 family metallopeptidase [Verrucomicrobiota bacterium]MBU1735523.1 M15 family metallopeptidase [Verrucomicrobiota bacterium]MBU1858136.1 M15 family metallopeptidase [Verrucomicrobiota bacterium]